MSKSAISRAICRMDELESRQLLSCPSGVDLTGLWADPASAGVKQAGRPSTTVTYTPAQIRTAYGITGDGSGQTIAIVDAYHAPTLVTDLGVFNTTYSLPTTLAGGGAVLTVATPQGTPAFNDGWAGEITLDVEWAHAVAPQAKILLVETASNSFADLLAGVDYARTQSGVSVVSMSWGGSEFAGEGLSDSHFTTPAGHSGVTFVASSGDSGGRTTYPSVSPNVLAVGGTTLTLASRTNAWSSETGWSGSGGGVSLYETKPAYQTALTQSQSKTQRTVPDVAYVGDPNTGVSVRYNNSWWTYGGTSVGAPQWAALVALANQARTTALDGPTQTLPAIYGLPSSDFHDISSGKAGKFTAGPGYDLVTGRGTPQANVLVGHLAGYVSTATALAASAPGDASGGSATAAGPAGGLFSIRTIDLPTEAEDNSPVFA